MDFAETISRAVGSCEVMVAVLGREWASIADKEGRRRLDDTDDLVRVEVETVLARNVLIIPLLVEGAVMPRREDLPSSLQNFARRQAHALRLETARTDLDALVRF